MKPLTAAENEAFWRAAFWRAVARTNHVPTAPSLERKPVSGIREMTPNRLLIQSEEPND